MSLNWRELELLLSELPLEGSWIQKITEHDVHSFTFSMYSRQERAWLLYFEVATPSSRVCRTGIMRKKSPNPQRFSQYLKAHIIGRRVEYVRQLPFDRAFILSLTNSEDRLRLLVRLFSGIGANIIVLDDQDTILELMYRRPQRGEEPGKKLLIEERTGEGSKTYAVRPWDGTSFNKFIDTHDTALGKEEKKEELLKKLAEKRDKELAVLHDRLRRQEERIGKTSGFDVTLHYADLLSASIHTVRKGMTEVTLEDWDGRAVTIPLEPALSPNENLEKLYTRYRKDKRTNELAVEEAEQTRSAIEETGRKYQELLEEGSLDRLQKEQEKPSEGRKQEEGKPGVRVMLGGFEVIVGRTAKENDEILRREARGSDIWLHTRDYAGAYVIIKAKKGKSVPLPVLLDAGSLAIHYSKAKKNGKAELYYTFVKYLRRVKDGKTGLVLPTQEKNLTVTLDEKRVKEILNDT